MKGSIENEDQEAHHDTYGKCDTYEFVRRQFPHDERDADNGETDQDDDIHDLFREDRGDALSKSAVGVPIQKIGTKGLTSHSARGYGIYRESHEQKRERLFEKADIIKDHAPPQVLRETIDEIKDEHQGYVSTFDGAEGLGYLMRVAKVEQSCKKENGEGYRDMLAFHPVAPVS